VSVGKVSVGKVTTGINKSNNEGEYSMTTILYITFKALYIILLNASMTLVLLTATQLADTHLPSLGSHKLVSVSWNG